MIELVDSDEFHKDSISETQFFVKKIKGKAEKFVKSKSFVYLVLWLGLLIFCVKMHVAKIFICLTGILLIFFNLGKRAPGTMSAYSIFNKNHEKLLGTMDSQEVDRQFANRMNEREDFQEKDPDYNEENALLKLREAYEKNQSKYANQACYCGSFKKYKKCCYWRELHEKNTKEKEK